MNAVFEVYEVYFLDIDYFHTQLARCIINKALEVIDSMLNN